MNALDRYSAQPTAQRGESNQRQHPIAPTSIKEIDGLKLVCSTKEKNVNFKFLVQSMKKCDKMIIVIGPEGGLSLNEEKFLIENEFYAMTLGNCIMRVETVPLYIMSALNYEYME